MPFEKGKSGNDKTKFSKDNQPNPEKLRGKRGKRLSTILKEMLKGISDGEELTQAEKIASKLIKEAQAGNIPAIKEVFDRTEGKAPQTMITKDGDAIDNMNKEELESLLETLNKIDSSSKTEK